MCDNVKDLLYKPIKQDSRNMAELGNKLGWDWLEQEGNKNTKNPGRAAGKAATYAATWYLGGPAWGSAASAGSTAATAAGEAALQTAGTVAAEEAAKQAALQALQEGGKQGLLGAVEGYTPQSLMQAAKSAGSGLKGSLMDMGKQAIAGGYNAMVPGVGPEQAAMLAEQTGSFGTQGLLKTMDAAGSANGLNSMQQLGAKAGGLLGKAGNNPALQKMAMQQASGLMQPQQQRGPMAAPPPQQGQQGPLPMPYQNNAIGNPMQGPPPGMSMEEWMKRKQMGLLGGM